MKKILFAFLFLLLAVEAKAVDRYIIASAGATGCSHGSTNYTAGTNTCGAGSSTVYIASSSSNFAAAVAATQAGDQLIFRAGTYTNAIFDTNSVTINSGTSFSNAPKFVAYTGETVNVVQLNIVGTTQYVLFESLVVDGDLCASCNQLVTVGGTAHHIRLTSMEVKNAPGNGVMLNQSAHHNEVIGGSVHDSEAYGFYVLGQDNLVERVKIYNNTGYAVHNYSANPGATPDRNIYRYNEIYDNAGGKLGRVFAGSAACVKDTAGRKDRGQAIKDVGEEIRVFAAVVGVAPFGVNAGVLKRVGGHRPSVSRLIYTKTGPGTQESPIRSQERRDEEIF